MPLYDYKCVVCGKEVIDVFHRIDECGPVCCDTPMDKQISAAPVHTFDSTRVFEHLSINPMTFGSKRALKRYCRDNGMIMDYVEGSP